MEFMCGSGCVYTGPDENKYGTRNGVINLRAVKHTLNVYFREFSRPVFRAALSNRRRCLEFDYEIQFGRNDGSRNPDFHFDAPFRTDANLPPYPLGRILEIMRRVTHFSR